MSQPAVVLVGPQRHHPTVVEVVQSLGLSGPYGLVTAGWESREAEEQALRQAVGGTWRNLGLFQRHQTLCAQDTALAEALNRRQDKLRALQSLYRLRLARAVSAARQLMSLEGDRSLLEPERADAIEAVRALDRHHLSRVAAIRRASDLEIAATPHPLLEQMRRELKQLVMDVEAVYIAGGHVAVLLNRLRLFDLEAVLRHKLVITWSAGAMALSELIVLFHDSPPQGPGNAEVLDRGLGLFRGVLPLPHGSARLNLSDPMRVRLLSARFSDMRPVLLDPTRRLDWVAPNWQTYAGVQLLSVTGTVENWTST
ncbi:MAG TPA: hypothetical protein ENK23_03760 [Sorangium sp.]|nr:hypothetical protein [Sorangium sp.]